MVCWPPAISSGTTVWGVLPGEGGSIVWHNHLSDTLYHIAASAHLALLREESSVPSCLSREGALMTFYATPL